MSFLDKNLGGYFGNFIQPVGGKVSGVYSLKSVANYEALNLWKPWKLFRKVTITATNIANMQVRIQLTTSNFNYADCKSDGSDLRFTTTYNEDATTGLSYWIESWVYNGTSIIWVKVPTSGTTSFYIRYSNPVATSLSSIDNVMNAGTRVRYYDGTGFNTLRGGATDSSGINYAWGSGTVSVAGMAYDSDTLSLTWDGWVLPYGSGTYTFYCTSDDGQRLYLNNTLVIDNWVDQGDTEKSYGYSWTDGLPKRFQYNMYENGGGATAKSGWTPPATGVKVYPVPVTYLRSPSYSSSYLDPYSYVCTIGSAQVV